MATYEYIALDAAGREQKGLVSADSARSARQELRNKKLATVRISVTQGKASRSPVPFLDREVFRRTVSTSELVALTRQLATLSQAAMPIEQALNTLAVQSGKKHMRGVLLDIRSEVLEGGRLSDAMRRQGRPFDSLYCSMIAAGEGNGNLSVVLQRLADDLEKKQRMARKVLSSLAYPVVLSLTAIGVVLALMTLVVPRVVEQFDGLGQALPALTRAMIAISEFLQIRGPLLLFLGVILVAGFAFALRHEQIRMRLDSITLKFPFVGWLTRSVEVARFSRTMASLSGSGIPVLQCVDAARQTVKNRVLREKLKGTVEAVRRGKSFSEALSRADVFPPMMVNMVLAGENAGSLDTMLDKVAEHLESEFEAVTDVMLSLLEPAIIIVMGGIVTLIVLSILLPILQLNTVALQ